MPVCVAVFCTNKRTPGCKQSFHRFPFSKPDILKKWISNVRRDQWHPNRNSLLCSDHFQEEAFDKTGQTIRIRDGAVPTVFNFLPPPKKVLKKHLKKTAIPTQINDKVATKRQLRESAKQAMRCKRSHLRLVLPKEEQMASSSETFENNGVDLSAQESSATQRKILEILCFDGLQYRYVYRRNDSVRSIKLELQGGLEIFVSMEDFDKLEPADLKPTADKLLDLIVPDVISDASPEEVISSPQPMISEPEVGTTSVAKESISDVESDVKDDGHDLLELCTQTDCHVTRNVKSLCQESNQVNRSEKSTFEKEDQLQCHQALHAPEHPFKCHLCAKTFKKETYLEEHKRTHSGKKSLSSSDCGKLFSQDCNLQNHQCSVHSKETLFNCDVCDQVFVTTQDLNCHLQIVHNKETSRCEKLWTPN